MFTSITSRIPIAPVRRRGAMGSILGVQLSAPSQAPMLDLRSSTASRFRVSRTGTQVTMLLSYDGSLPNSGVVFSDSTNPGAVLIGRGDALFPYVSLGITNSGGFFGAVLGSTGGLGWVSGTFAAGAPDLVVARDAADTLAQRRSTNAQTFRVYNTYTDASNYERAKLSWSSNELLIGTEKGSGGGVARPLKFQTDGTTRAGITTTGSTYIGSGAAALATTATDGFLYIPTCAGAPTGVPTAITGTAPLVADSTNNKVYCYLGGAWVALN